MLVRGVKTKEAMAKEFAKRKRDYIKSNLNNDNVYTYLTSKQKEVIRKYYEQYTVILFNRLRGSLRLEVSKSKAKKLSELKGAGEWEFAGMVDMLVKGSETCELGHPLRYCYYAKNVENGNLLIFGSTCVGDFFDLAAEDVKALTNLKDIMLKEIKEMVAIKENNWFNDYRTLNSDIIGRVWHNMGADALNRLDGVSHKGLMTQFLDVGLPLPTTLLSEILTDKETVLRTLDEFIIFPDETIIKKIYNCGIPFISEVYSIALTDIVETTKTDSILLETQPNILQIHKYFGFKNKDILLETINIWLKRAERTTKAINYFRKIGVVSPWVDLFRECMKDSNREENIYLGLNLLSVFDLEGTITKVYSSTQVFPYKTNGVELRLEVLDNFDILLDTLAKKNSIDYIVNLESRLSSDRNIELEQKNKEVKIIEYILENIDKPQYQAIWGKDAIKDILINKSLTFDKMTVKQAKFVERFYTEMQGVDLRDTVESSQSLENRTYTLNEKPEVIAKIQRLQNEADDVVPQKTKDIMLTILKYKRVSDRQLRHINESYLEYVIGEKPTTSTEDIKPDVQPENKKYKLKDRPDIKGKLEDIQNSKSYESLPIKTREIITSVLKYNTVSDKQLIYIESAYAKVRG